MSTVAALPSVSPVRRLAASVRALPRSVAIAVTGIATVGLHIVDDNFLQPQPGTEPGDHLVSGLVPLAVLALAAWSYPRVRAGAQATMAMLLGIFALVTSVEAVYYTREAGPSGDDYTGLAAIPAGVLLTCVALTTLWRSRRLDDRKRWRYPRRALIAAACVPAFIYFVFPTSYAYVANHIGRTVVEDVDLGPNVQQISFTTSDGLTLDGSYIPSTNGAAIVASPGYNDAPAHARMLARHGFGVLLFHQRGEGTSDGDPNAWGWAAEKDMDAAIEFLKARPDVEAGRIGGLGLSVAGETLLQTAAHNDDLRAVVSEGAGNRSYKEWLDMPNKSEMLPLLPLELTFTAANVVYAGELPPPNLGKLVSEIAPRPIFLIEAGKGVPSEKLNPQFDEAAGKTSELWQLPEAGHTEGIKARPHEYERRVVGFFDDALLGER